MGMLIVLLLLASCAGSAASLLSTGSSLQAAGDAYIFENIDARKWVRAECREILDAEVTQLKAESKYDEARQLLRDSYPSLVTISIVRAAEKDGVSSLLAAPPGCGKTPVEAPETSVGQ